MNKQTEVRSTVEALKLALEALEETLRTLDDENAKPGGAISDTIWYSEHETLFDYIAAQITAIREALAEQPAQQHIEYCLWARNGHTPCPHVQPAQQQEPVAWLIAYEVCCGRKNRGSSLKKFDEVWAKCSFVSEDKDAEINASKWRNRKETPLYTSPPANANAGKPWVGLTDEEIQKIWRNSEHMTVNQVCRAIEAKLREKNA